MWLGYVCTKIRERDGKRNAVLRHQPDTATTRTPPASSPQQLEFYCSAFIRYCPPPRPSSGTVPQQVFNAAKAAASSDNLNKLYVIICVYQQNNGILNVKTARCFSCLGKGNENEGGGEGGVPLQLPPLSICLAFYDAFYVRVANRAN